MLEGGCLCGSVRYRIDGKIGPIVFCHCKECQRASGSAYAANAGVRERYFSLTAGKEKMVEFESAPGKFRAFCGSCGSPLYSRRPAADGDYRLRIGTLDSDPGRKPAIHIWTSDMEAWQTIDDALPQYPREFTEEQPA